MELRQLKTFLTVAHLLNFNRAGEALNYAQSTVSAQIKALEEDFGVSLFDRLGKRVILTEAGKMLTKYAQKMLDVEKETMGQMSNWEAPQGSISIRIPQSISTFYLPSIIQKFQEKYPKVSFDASTCAFNSLQQELRSGIIDVAFLMTESVDVVDLKTEMLKIEPLVVVAMPGHKLTTQPNINIVDIANEILLLPKHDCGYTMRLKQTLIEEKIESTTIMEFNNIETIKRCVKKGVGISLLPEIAVTEELDKKEMVALPGPDEGLEIALLMIWHKDKWISPTLAVFMDEVKKVIK